MSGRILPFRRGQAKAAPARTGGMAGVGAQDPELRSPRGGDPGGTASLIGPSQAARFRDLVLPHLAAAHSLARYLARDAAAAEDIAQEALVKALRNIETVRGEVKPWLLAIVRNTYFDWRRRDRGWSESAQNAETALEKVADPGQESPETTLIRQGDVAALRRAIEAIPEPFREALILRDLEELSYRQVADITGAPMGTVMSRLARARRMLGERLGVMEAAS
ncbi:MAG: sigma-70 family RNA polymerase sigma factor [Caulobacterales bacterium]